LAEAGRVATTDFTAKRHTGSPFNWKEIIMETQNGRVDTSVPWNKGKLTDQKPPLKLPAIRPA
jgi:hypothetical protein